MMQNAHSGVSNHQQLSQHKLQPSSKKNRINYTAEQLIKLLNNTILIDNLCGQIMAYMSK
jgi:hypothetical protein